MLSPLLSSKFIGACSFECIFLCWSPPKELLFFKFRFFVLQMVLNTASGPFLPTELRLDTPRLVSHPQSCCWSSAQRTGTASSCSGHNGQEQDRRVREEDHAEVSCQPEALSCSRTFCTSHKSPFLCKAQLKFFTFTFIQTLPSLPVHQFWILVYPFHPHNSYYSAALLGLAPVAFPWVWVSKCCNQ